MSRAFALEGGKLPAERRTCISRAIIPVIARKKFAKLSRDGARSSKCK
jgi:hypothetical protein